MYEHLYFYKDACDQDFLNSLLSPNSIRENFNYKISNGISQIDVKSNKFTPDFKFSSYSGTFSSIVPRTVNGKMGYDCDIFKSEENDYLTVAWNFKSRGINSTLYSPFLVKTNQSNERDTLLYVESYVNPDLRYYYRDQLELSSGRDDELNIKYSSLKQYFNKFGYNNDALRGYSIGPLNLFVHIPSIKIYKFLFDFRTIDELSKIKGYTIEPVRY